MMRCEEDLSICHECVGDEFLKIGIRREGRRGKCSYCERSRKVIPLPVLADRIHHAIEEHFCLTSDEPDYYEYALLKDEESNYEWERQGEQVDYLIQSIAEIDDNVASDVQSYLSSCHGGDPRDFEENPYGDEVCYEEKSPESYPFQETWKFFCHEIRYRARFFSESIEDVLGSLFRDLCDLKTYNGSPVIVDAGPDTKYSIIFRARVCLSHETLDRVLKNPIKELGAPPSKLSRQGRMNAEGVAVFYGAADAETCIAEVRPPVGSNVVVGCFRIIKKIKLLSLDLLSQVYPKGSYFDPEFGSRKGHAFFLNELVGEFVKPVMPGNEMFEYLPTQVVAEYLAEKVKPKLDGIIFESSQIEGEGQNIILFHDACYIEQCKPVAGAKISVQYGHWNSEDDYDDDITIFEELPDNTKKAGYEKPLNNFNDFENNFVNNREPTLALDITNRVDVRAIKGVCYKTHKRFITRIQERENERKETVF